MRIVLDTNVLVQVLRNAKREVVLTDPATGNPLDRVEARAAALIDQVDMNGDTALIPTPTLAEFLVGVNHSFYHTYLDAIDSVSCFEVVSFDEISAMECARLVDDAELKVLDPIATKAKVRFDRQILAIAIANNAEELWTHDVGLYAKARQCGLRVKSLADIQPIPEQLQVDLGV